MNFTFWKLVFWISCMCISASYCQILVLKTFYREKVLTPTLKKADIHNRISFSNCATTNHKNKVNRINRSLSLQWTIIVFKLFGFPLLSLLFLLLEHLKSSRAKQKWFIVRYCTNVKIGRVFTWSFSRFNPSVWKQRY